MSKTLEQIREDARLSKDDLAKKTGISYKQINLIETGKVRPRSATLWKLADALGVKPSEVVAALATDTPTADVPTAEAA